METKQILLVLSAAADGRDVVDLAANLARRQGATVAGVCLFQEPAPDPIDPFAAGLGGVAELMAQRSASLEALTGRAAALFRAKLTDQGLSDAWTVGELELWRDDVVQLARTVDLVMFAAPEDADFRSLAEMLVLHGGSPCLVAPRGAAGKSGFERIVLGWNGSREAKRAIDDSLQWLTSASTVGIAVAREETTRWLDVAQIEPLVRHLASHGVAAEVLVPEERGMPVGAGLAEQCEAFGADLLVMGAHGHARDAELAVGGATRAMLTHTSLPVLLSH